MAISRACGVAFCLSCLCLPAAAGEAGGPEPALPEKLREIVAANSASLRKLATCAATVEVHTFATTKGETPLSYTDLCSVWVKGRRAREDSVAASDDPNDIRRVLVEQDKDKKVYSEAPQELRRVVTPMATLTYAPAAANVVKTNGRPDPLRGDRPSILHRYARLLTGSLEQVAADNAAKGHLPSISQDSVDGIGCKLLTWELPKINVIAKVWVAPSKGYMIKRLETTYKGQLMEEWSVRLREYGDGVFWFEAVDAKRFSKGSLKERVQVRVKKLDFNAVVDDRLFTIEGMGVPPGTQVDDRVAGVRYRYGTAFVLPDGHAESVVSGLDAPEAQPADDAATSPSTPSTQEVAGRSPAPGSAPPGRPSWWWTLALIVGAAAAVAAATIAAVLRRRRQTAGTAGKRGQEPFPDGGKGS